MLSFLETPEARLVLWAAGLAIVLVLAVYVVAKVRNGLRADADEAMDANALLTKFREIHAQGGLSDEEFRTIKTRLTDGIHQQIKGNGETGCGA